MIYKRIVVIALCLIGCASESDVAFPSSDEGGISVSTGGASATPAATTGSCNPVYCPSSGGGKGCCITANGPCGVDLGMGCMSSAHDSGK